MTTPEANVSKSSSGDIYDLAVTLFTPGTLFENRVGGNRWVVFVPDFEGLPVLIDAVTHKILHAFEGGALVADVLASQPDFVSSLLSIGALEERGFLRATPVTLPYATPPPRHKHKDFSVWLHITNRCNLTCSYCFVGEKTKDGMTPEVMYQVACDIRNTAERYGTEEIAIKFSGGEPTIFVPKIEHFREILLEAMQGSTVQVRFAVLSNGTLVNHKLLDFLTRTKTSISISLDGYGDAHDIYRIYRSGKGSWKTVSANIEKLINHGIRPYIMATISAESCSSLPELVQWIYAHGLNGRLSVVRNPSGSWAGGDRAKEYADYNATLAAAFDRAFRVLEDPGVVMDLRTGLDLCELYFERPTHGRPCGIGDNHLVIKPDGTLVACPMTIAEKGVKPSGDLLESAAATFSHSPSERHYERLEGDCLNCQWFGVCSGGCPITNLRVKGHAFAQSPLCSFYKSVIPRYLQFFGTKLQQAEMKNLDLPSLPILEENGPPNAVR